MLVTLIVLGKECAHFCLPEEHYGCQWGFRDVKYLLSPTMQWVGWDSADLWCTLGSHRGNQTYCVLCVQLCSLEGSQNTSKFQLRLQPTGTQISSHRVACTLKINSRYWGCLQISFSKKRDYFAIRYICTCSNTKEHVMYNYFRVIWYLISDVSHFIVYARQIVLLILQWLKF